jgi:hypothetical protein
MAEDEEKTPEEVPETQPDLTDEILKNGFTEVAVCPACNANAADNENLFSIGVVSIEGFQPRDAFQCNECGKVFLIEEY